MRKKFTFLAAFASFVCSLPAIAQQHQALKLNDSNFVSATADVVNYGGDFTIEFWAYIEDSAMDHKVHQFVSEGANDGIVGFHIGFDGTDGTILIGDSWYDADFNPQPTTGIKMPLHRWTHIAVTYNFATAITKLYLNGQLMTTGGLFFHFGVAFQIGRNVDGNQPSIGKIDDLKSWYYERSAFSVKRDMFNDPDPDDPTLFVWYKLDDNGTNIVDNVATTGGASKEGTILGPGAPNSWTYSPIQNSSNGLTFNGSEGDQVIIPDSVAYDTTFNDTKGGTIEFWVSTTALTSSWSTLVSKYGQYSILLNATQIGIDNGSGIPFTYTLDAGDFPQGFATSSDPWAHLAFVYDPASTNTALYYNGQPLGSITGSMGAASHGQPLTFGVTRDNGGTDSRPFSGGIDEVRLWSSQQTADDILNNYNSTLSGTETNLVSQFTFDQGVPDMDNTGMLTAFDNVASFNGTLANFQLSGTASNFNSHMLLNVAVPLPISLTKFTALRQSSDGLLQWQTSQEENSRDFTIERSADGKNYTTIGVVAAAGKSSTPLNYTFTDLTPVRSVNYYRLKQSDLDDKYTYSPVRTLNFSESSRLGWYSTGKLSVEVNLLQGNNERYSLSDISGRTLRQGQLSGGKTEVSHLPAGVYIVRVVTKVGETLTKKIFLY
jgi:hypothetical protein